MGVESFPCFDENGNIYFGSHDCCFYSVNKDGKINWSYSFKRKVYSSPAYYNKKIFFIGGDGYMHSLDTAGKRLWSKNLDDYSKNAGKIKNIVGKALSAIQLDEFKFFKVKGWASPIVTTDGQVIGLGLGNKIFSFNQETGDINWAFEFKRFGFNLSGPVLDSDDNIYVPSCDGYLYCLSSTGKLKWNTKLGKGLFWGNISMDTSQQYLIAPMFINTSKSVIYKISRSGRLIWKTEVKTGVKGAVAIHPTNGSLYLAGTNGLIVCLDENGKVLKSVKKASGNNGFWTTPVIDGNKNILVGGKLTAEKGALMYLTEALDEIWSLKDEKIGKIFAPPYIASNGEVYFGTWNGNFLCYK
ncbi:MAG: outer membrane protein assembly factor BamB family protein [Chitinophagaceae bacterium]